MKIVSWNVNGIRACHRKGEFLSLLEGMQPDILCIQETKAWPEQLESDLLADHGYHVTWAVAEKKGYSGVATFSKTPPQRVTVGLDEHQFDREGRVITSIHGSVAVVNAYFPNGQRDHARLPYKTDFYRRMLAHGQALEKQGLGVVICGDWNTAHHEIDLKNWKSNRKTSGFTLPERALVTEFCDAGYRDAFRTLHPEKGDTYTWWSNRAGVRERNIGWRIDYHFVSANLWSKVKSASIHDSVLGSDHCPIELSVRLD